MFLLSRLCIYPPQDMQGKPIDANYTKWRVGEDAIRVSDLRLAAFEQVSAGSWQTRLFYMAPH